MDFNLSRTIYLIDSENVNDAWVSVVSDIGQRDQIVVFYTDNSANMSVESVSRLAAGNRQMTWKKCFTGTNALDFQLVSELGSMISKRPKDIYVIVANDTGYDAVVKYWSGQGIRVSRTSVDTEDAGKKHTHRAGRRHRGGAVKKLEKKTPDMPLLEDRSQKTKQSADASEPKQKPLKPKESSVGSTGKDVHRKTVVVKSAKRPMETGSETAKLTQDEKPAKAEKPVKDDKPAKAVKQAQEEKPVKAAKTVKPSGKARDGKTRSAAEAKPLKAAGSAQQSDHTAESEQKEEAAISAKRREKPSDGKKHKKDKGREDKNQKKAKKSKPKKLEAEVPSKESKKAKPVSRTKAVDTDRTSEKKVDPVEATKAGSMKSSDASTPAGAVSGSDSFDGHRTFIDALTASLSTAHMDDYHKVLVHMYGNEEGTAIYRKLVHDKDWKAHAGEAYSPDRSFRIDHFIETVLQENGDSTGDAAMIRTLLLQGSDTDYAGLFKSFVGMFGTEKGRKYYTLFKNFMKIVQGL